MRYLRTAYLVPALIFCGAALSSCSMTSNIPSAASPTDFQSLQRPHGDSAATHAYSRELSGALLYVLNQHDVTFYSYPKGKLLGTIKNKDFYLADGACVDKKGNVYVANYGTDQLFEYAHGGTTLLRTLKPPVGATGCAVNWATGDLAVAGNAGLNVYKNARGTPSIYRNSAFEAYYYCSYDNKGDLFVDGYSQPGSGHTILARLPQGGQTLQMVDLKQTIQWPGEVQWVGKHLTVEDDGGVSESNGAIYEFSIAGSHAHETDVIALNKSGIMHQSWIEGNVVLVPAICWPKSCYGSSVLFYQYPDGGNSFRKIAKDVRGPLGLVVSPSQT